MVLRMGMEGPMASEWAWGMTWDRWGRLECRECPVGGCLGDRLEAACPEAACPVAACPVAECPEVERLEVQCPEVQCPGAECPEVERLEEGCKEEGCKEEECPEEGCLEGCLQVEALVLGYLEVEWLEDAGWLEDPVL